MNDSVCTVLRIMAADATENRDGWGDPDATAQAARDAAAIDYVDQLIQASRRTIDAFKALGKANGFVDNTRAHAACERAMQVQSAALDGWASGATNDQGATA